MKRFLAILRITVTVLLCLVLLLNLWLLVARFFFHQELPKVFGFSQAIVVSGSMEPSFSAGDMLLYRECEAYNEGDVVIFRSNGAYVTHRIVGKEAGGFITKGDANNTADQSLADPAWIEGKMVAVIPGIGGLLTFLRTPLGLLILIVVGIALLEAPAIVNRCKRRK